KFDGDLNTREVTDKYKAPVNEVIVVGTKVETNNESYNDDVKVDVEYVEDDTLYKGTVNKGELTPGKVERKIVNKYDPETGKVSTEEKVVVTPAKQKIIVGTKDFTGEFSHKIERTIPFETEIQYDDTMDAGTKEVTQKGVTGNAEQTVTQKYTNGELANKEYTDEITTKEPVKEIVKIGTKPVEKKVEIPFNTEYIYDNTIDAGTVVEDKDHPGKAGSVTVKTYFDKELGKFVSVEDETSKQAPVNKIVRVGTKPTENMCPVPVEPEKPEDNKPGKPNEENLGEENHNKPNENVNPGEQSEYNKPNKKDNNSSNSENKEPGKSEQDKSDKESEQEKSSEAKSNPSGETSDKLEQTSKNEKSPEELGEYYVSKNKYSETIKGKKAKSNTNINDYSKAPKTYDAGIDGYVGIAGLAASALAFLQRKKKEDEE
ncbi:G5 domain-containing protein, partial [Peptoniphilus duerdenii]|uniref:G5 domain-containing protein n=1 Tax=Peptoniphilus duerdenii TaxID=507750 RepID=UPI0023F03EF9